MSDLFTSSFSGRPAYQAACHALVGVGYEASNIRRDHEIPVSKTEQRWSIAGVAFTDRLSQAQHAGVTIFDLAGSGLSEQDAAARLRLTTAPFHLVFDEMRGSFFLWAIGPNEKISLSQPLLPNDLTGGLQEFARDLKPEKVRRVKQGLESFEHRLLAELNPLQLTFWAEEANSKLLTEHFGHVLSALKRAGFADSRDQGKLAAQLLAARILIDTGAMNDCGSVGEIPQAAEAKHFKGYFDASLLQRHKARTQDAYELLKRISLATFQPEMLRHLYKSLFGKKETKVRGRFDTPLWLTRRIWQNIPVEFLRPEDRLTADLTCGWGSFLISAEERLSQLLDMQGRRLSRYIFGNDNDVTTAELARVALLASTGKDSWRIDHEDALQWQPQARRLPNIIVGNPPFSGDRKTQRSEDTGGKRHELANEFLSRAVDLLAPDGFLAMVMPGSFVASEAGPETRRQLLNSCDIFEIWDLPAGIFDDASVQPMVIFAHKIKNKSDPSRFPVRIRNIQKQESQLEKFKESGEFTRSTFISDQDAWKNGHNESETVKTTHIFSYSTVLNPQEWNALTEKSTELGKIARVVNGCIRGNPKRNGLKLEKPTTVGWLTRPSQSIPCELNIDYSQATRIRYPNDLEWPRYEERNVFEQEKILLVSDPNPSWGKRIKLAIERRGYFASESFFAVAPRGDKPHMTLEALAAVMRWKVCNAWVLENLRYPKINKRIVDSMPIPSSLIESPTDCKQLSTAFTRIQRATLNGKSDTTAEQEIDEILRNAYGLTDVSVWNRLVTVYNWDVLGNSRCALDEPTGHRKTDWIAQGAVLEVNATQGSIGLWLNSLDELQTVPIVPAMPGWLLRPGVRFIVKVSESEIRARKLTGNAWGRFEPEVYTYFSPVEAARLINATVARRKGERR